MDKYRYYVVITFLMGQVNAVRHEVSLKTFNDVQAQLHDKNELIYYQKLDDGMPVLLPVAGKFTIELEKSKKLEHIITPDTKSKIQVIN